MEPSICIGGPRAGELVAQRGEIFEVAVMPGLPRLAYSIDEMERNVELSFTRERYYRDMIGPFEVWRHESLSQDEMVAALLRHYVEAR